MTQIDSHIERFEEAYSPGSLVVTYPFHPLKGQRLNILFARKRPEGRLYVCEGGPLGTIGVERQAKSLGTRGVL